MSITGGDAMLFMTLRLSFFRRLLALSVSLLGALALLFLSVIFVLISFLNALFCAQLRFLHKSTRKLRLRLRWLLALNFTLFLCCFTPGVACLFLVSFARVYGHSIPHSWLKFMLKIDLARFCFGPELHQLRSH